MIYSTLTIILSSLFLLFASSSPAVEELSWYTLCHARCVAGCVQNGVTLKSCISLRLCQAYNEWMCLPEMTRCWAECRDLGPAGHLEQPENIRAEYVNGARKLVWNPVLGATLYVVQYKSVDADVNYTTVATMNPWIDNFQPANSSFCDPLFVQVAAFSGMSYSNFYFARIDPPRPSITPRMQHVSTEYSNEPFVGDSYEANGTILIKFQIEDKDWPLGIADLAIIPKITVTGCDNSDLYLPVNELKLVANASQQLAYSIGADIMLRECRYTYYIESVTSEHCQSVKKYAEPPENEQEYLDINCDSVTNSPCSSIPYFTFSTRHIHIIGSIIAIFAVVICCKRSMKPTVPRDPMPSLPYATSGTGNKDHVYEDYDDKREYDKIRYADDAKEAGPEERDVLTMEKDG